MKKVLVLVLALVMVMSMGTMAFANTQVRTTVLSADKTEILVGESIAFSATTLKHGSNYANPTWYLVDEEGQRTVISSVGDEDVTTTVYADDYYTSSRSIKFTEAGTYVVEFEIVMAAGKGKSNVQFVATDRIVIIVHNPIINERTLVDWKVKSYKIEYHGKNGASEKLVLMKLELFYDSGLSGEVEVEKDFPDWNGSVSYRYLNITKTINFSDLDDYNGKFLD